jgi:LacI family transcriptional regulator
MTVVNKTVAEKTRKGKSTIFDVASAAGVSIKTVSRVVNNEPNVRVKTREKVLTAIQELNYQPNSAARGLSGKRSYVIGLVYENPHEFSYVGDVLNGAIEACESEGYALLLRPITLPAENVAESVRQFVTQTRVDGLVLPAPICDSEEVLALLEELNIPFAMLSPKNPRAHAISILCEEEQASFELTEYVIKQGHKRIGFVKGHPDHGASEKRYNGYRRALKANRITYDSSLVSQGYFDFESGRKAARKLLALAERPTVILSSNDDMAAGVLYEARETGCQVPEDLSIVGFDDTPLASHLWPPLTTVRQPIRRMADSATRLLIKKLRGDEVIDLPELFHCEVIIRGSTTHL